MRPVIKELSIEPYNDISILHSVAANLDGMDFKNVKTKYARSKGDFPVQVKVADSVVQYSLGD